MKNKKNIKKIKAIEKSLSYLRNCYRACSLCPRNCGVNRAEGEKGFCKAGKNPAIYSWNAHHGEEPSLSGTKGSGTIFFSHCNMSCVYCQNWQFSQKDEGKEITSQELSRIMLGLESSGVHNINLVSPAHFVPVIAEALLFAYEGGLSVPIVYNTGGYDSLDLVKSLSGIIDIYLPDMRYSLDKYAIKYSNAPGYAEANRAIVNEMYTQVGDLVTEDNIAQKGLIIRLLALPEGISGTLDTLQYISKNLSTDVYLSVMSQYYPAYKAGTFKELSRRIREEEYLAITHKIEEIGFSNGWVQPFSGSFDECFQGEKFLPNV